MSLPLLHATVLFGFPRQVSNRLRGLLLSTPPSFERNQYKRLCGAPLRASDRLRAGRGEGPQ
jgi:hypothetical protein